MNLQTARGVRDLPPEEQISRQQLIDNLRRVFERYGFPPMDTPTIERFDILSAKYAGGAEILKEAFRLKDQGGRELGLRYDLTVPMCRYVGMNPTIKMPFKRYQIGSVFRDGPVEGGRYREFTQCDIDIVGAASMLADAQMLEIAQSFFEEIGLPVKIEVNSRKLLDGIMEGLGIPETNRIDIILAVDKLKKIGLKGVEEELKTKKLLDKKTDELLKILTISGTNLQKLEALRPLVKTEKGKEGLQEIEELLGYLDNKNIVFSLGLVRGLAYYTGNVFEVFAAAGDFTSSLGGGGRYDRLIGEYLGNNKTFPAVGFSFGIDRIDYVLNGKEKQKSVTKAMIVPIGTAKESASIARELRKAGINTDMDLLGRSISKNLDYADKMGIPFAVIVGEKEVKAKKVTLKNMKSGEEKKVSLKKAIEIIRCN